jgi:NET1-associated nuclear protein 1 (U3 small nucleolar RNA-associated protein 17)
VLLLTDMSLGRIKLGSDRTVTVVQCHPNSNTLAIGDNTGRIVLYYNVTHKNTRSQTVYHWHTLPVNDVIFTSSGKINHFFNKIKYIVKLIHFISGNNFYSGGAENVLVKWFCENTETRHYLPRLSANIVHLSVTEDSQYVAVSTQSNSNTT